MSRTERYRKRCGDESNSTIDETNPLPKLIDPITLEPVVTPAISPFGHVMGLATWKVELLIHGLFVAFCDHLLSPQTLGHLVDCALGKLLLYCV